MKIKLLLIIVYIFLGILFIFLAIKKPVIFKPKAENVCGSCSEGASCSLEGQYCEILHHCDGTTPVVGVYQCLTESDGRKWRWRYPQAGSYCFGSQCGGAPLPSPTPAGHNCYGGTFGIHFVADRNLAQGESINCTVSGTGSCSVEGSPCDGAFRGGSCNISAGGRDCWVSNLDCSCNPFNYSCSGTSSTAGSFSGGEAVNGGSKTVSLNLPAAPPPPQPLSTATPTPQPTRTPSPTKTPTATPTPTQIPTQTLTPTPTPTTTPTLSQTPTNIPVPSNTPTPTGSTFTQISPTNTPVPTSTITPSPTEIILAQQISSPTPTTESRISPQPTIMESGKIQPWIFALPILIILMGLIF